MATEVWLRERRDEVDVKLRRYLLALLTGVLALGLMPAASSGQESGDRYEHLEPGSLADLDERVPVNFVFVGYERDDVNAGRFLAGLPREYKPVVRSRLFYNESLKRSLLGLNYTYDYNVRFADSDYEERLFGFLSRSARPAPLSDFQKLYNGNGLCTKIAPNPLILVQVGILHQNYKLLQRGGGLCVAPSRLRIGSCGELFLASGSGTTPGHVGA